MLIISSDLIQFDNLSKLLKGKLQQGLRVVNAQFPLTYTIFYVILKYDLCNDIHGLNLKKNPEIIAKINSCWWSIQHTENIAYSAYQYQHMHLEFTARVLNNHEFRLIQLGKESKVYYLIIRQLDPPSIFYFLTRQVLHLS